MNKKLRFSLECRLHASQVSACAFGLICIHFRRPRAYAEPVRGEYENTEALKMAS
jgi:hypothetical protein